MTIEVPELAYRTCDYIAYLYKKPAVIRRFMQEATRDPISVKPVLEGLLDIGVFSLNPAGNFSVGYANHGKSIIPHFNEKRLYFTDSYDAEIFAEILNPGLQVKSVGEYSLPNVMDERSWMILRKKSRFESRGSICALDDVIRGGILTSSRTKGYSVRFSAGRRIFPVAGNSLYFVNEDDAILFKKAMDNFFTILNDTRELEVTKD